MQTGFVTLLFLFCLCAFSIYSGSEHCISRHRVGHSALMCDLMAMTNMTAWPLACTDIHGECRCRFVRTNKYKHTTTKKRQLTGQTGWLKVFAQLYTPYHPPAAEGLIGVGETSHNNSFTDKSEVQVVCLADSLHMRHQS